MKVMLMLCIKRVLGRKQEMQEKEERHGLEIGVHRTQMLEEMSLQQDLAQMRMMNQRNARIKKDSNILLETLILDLILNHQIIYTQDQICHQLHQNLADRDTRSYLEKNQCSSMCHRAFLPPLNQDVTWNTIQNWLEVNQTTVKHTIETLEIASILILDPD